MQSNAERLNNLRLMVARVRDGRLERLMQRVKKQRERSQSRNREKLFEQAREIAKTRQATLSAN
ncbi:MAG: hypothetical protein AAFR90_04795 [Pseudomonadota bacterium]